MDILRNMKCEVPEAISDETENFEKEFSLPPENSFETIKDSTNQKSTYVNASKLKDKNPNSCQAKSEISENEKSLGNKESAPKVPIFRYRSTDYVDGCKTRYLKKIISKKEVKILPKLPKLPEQLPCGICSKSFTHREELLEHLKTHTGKIPIKKNNEKSQAVVKIFSCKTCEKSFASTRDFRYHRCLSAHVASKALVKCSYCFEDVQEKLLPAHIRKFHIDQDPYLCGQCNAGFKTKRALKEHLDTCLGILHSCEVCKKRFHKPEKLKKHMRLHGEKNAPTPENNVTESPAPVKLPSEQHAETNILPVNPPQSVLNPCDNPLMCRICSTSFTQEDTFQQHLQTHSVDHFINCKKCGLRFQDGADYKAHSKLHIKLYPCGLCKGTFQKSELQNHMKVHSDLLSANKKKRFNAVVKIIHCEYCEKTFGLERDLAKHHETVHKDIKRFPCELCSAGFTRNYDLISHIKIRHLNEKPKHLDLNIPCEACGKCFTNKTSLRRHLKIHTDERRFSCDFCKKRFLTFHARQVHLRVHTRERPFTCDVCQKSFGYNNTFQDHMKTHSQNKLSCDLCKRIFTRKIHWLNHIKKCSELNSLPDCP